MNTFAFVKSTMFLLVVVMAFLIAGCDMDDSLVVETPKTPTHTNRSDPKAPDTKTPVVAKQTSRVSEAQQKEYLDILNAVRAEEQNCGTMGVFDSAPALTWNVRLDNAAYEHSNDMAKSNTFSHIGSGTITDITAQKQVLGRGSKFSERVQNNGYTHYRKAGENIAAGYATAQEAVDAWLASDHHCANLMDPAFTEVGMVLVEKEGSDYGFYWSQEFGGR